MRLAEGREGSVDEHGKGGQEAEIRGFECEAEVDEGDVAVAARHDERGVLVADQGRRGGCVQRLRLSGGELAKVEIGHHVGVATHQRGDRVLDGRPDRDRPGARRRGDRQVRHRDVVGYGHLVEYRHVDRRESAGRERLDLGHRHRFEPGRCVEHCVEEQRRRADDRDLDDRFVGSDRIGVVVESQEVVFDEQDLDA